MDRYPVYIGSEKKGTLTVKAQGLMTCFEVECGRTDELVRLSVYGEDKTAYLGTLSPQGDKLCLTKKFSRTELKNMPRKILYAADAKLQNRTQDNEITWYESQNGVLYADMGAYRLNALPTAGANFPEERIRRINGREYVVFRLK